MKQTADSNLRKYASDSICDLAIGRVKALETEAARDLIERLTESIEILEKTRSVLSDVNMNEVVAELAEILSRRGKQHDLDEHYDQAVADLRRAFDLVPDDTSIRDQYCVYLVHDALHKEGIGLRDQARTIIEQAKRIAEQGLLDHPDDLDFKATLDWIQDEMYPLQPDGSEEAAWAELDLALEHVRQSSDDSALRELVKEAEVRRENADYVGAASLVEQVLQRNVDYAWARAEAVQIYVQWGFELLDEGNLEEAQQKAWLAAQYGIDNVRMDELHSRIQQTKGLLGR